jgi:hypothetical protein
MQFLMKMLRYCQAREGLIYLMAWNDISFKLVLIEQVSDIRRVGVD